jgi:GR25 family glycosyltransferase involved in LPS biosynthesis
MIISIQETKFNKTKKIIDKNFNDSDFIDTGIYIKHPTDRLKGCYESHISNLEKFIDLDYEYLLSCEDDLYVNTVNKIDLKKIINEVKEIDNNFNIIYLGHRLSFAQDCNFYHTNNRNYIKVKTNDLHCFIISKQFAKILIKNYKKNGYQKPIDLVIKDFENYNEHYYALTNQIAYQEGINQIEQKVGQIFIKLGGYNKELRYLITIIFSFILIYIIFKIKKYIR